MCKEFKTIKVDTTINMDFEVLTNRTFFREWQLKNVVRIAAAKKRNEKIVKRSDTR